MISFSHMLIALKLLDIYYNSAVNFIFDGGVVSSVFSAKTIRETACFRVTVVK